MCKVNSTEELSPGIIKFTVQAPEIAKRAVPGQFLEIKCTEKIDTTLRRPISISNKDFKNGLVEFIVQTRGEATSALARTKSGEMLDLLGPIGKGFGLKKTKNPVIIGGGIGAFPLHFLAKTLDNPNLKILLGFRNKNAIVLEDEFSKINGKLTIATDDGSYGHNGFVTELLLDQIKNSEVDMIYACGPLPMLKKVRDIALQNNIPCQISVEERMACGVGVCLGCAIKLIDGDDWRYGHVCKDGPVFEAQKVILE
ncbi:MAG: dihydroorotate dehydrogenase electron transfer subunit [Deltaproteobacteria bacterium]